VFKESGASSFSIVCRVSGFSRSSKGSYNNDPFLDPAWVYDIIFVIINYIHFPLPRE
jgi:hypothetical protein